MLSKNTKFYLKTAVVLGLFLDISACAVAPPIKGERPTTWSQPITETLQTPVTPLNVLGLTNVYRINSQLYRTAQPKKEAFVFLNEDLKNKQSLFKGDQPIKTVVSLRGFHDDNELLPANNALNIEHIKFDTWNPKTEYVVKFLKIATDPTKQPVMVHCLHGSDRTGTMIASYRIVVQGWTKEQALAEMMGGGYGYHPIWKGLPKFIHALDVEGIQQSLKNNP